MTIRHKRIETMSALWVKPEVPHDYDEEFDGPADTLPSGWTETFTPSGSIDPYASFSSGVRRSINSWRSSCYVVQSPRNDVAYYISKAITVPTNFFVWYRAHTSLTYGDSSGNNGSIALALGTSNAGGTGFDDSLLRLYMREADAGDTNQIQVEKTVSGSGTTVMESIDRGSTGTGTMYYYGGIQKIGTTFYFWAFSNSGQMFYLGTTSFTATCDRVGLQFKNNDENDIISVDFIRFKESATFLPGFGQ